MLKILLALMIMLSPLTSEEGKEIIEDESYKDDVYITVSLNPNYSELIDQDGNVVLTSNDDFYEETESFYRTTESYDINRYYDDFSLLHRVYDKSFNEIGLYNRVTIGDNTFIAFTDKINKVLTYTLFDKEGEVIKTISNFDRIVSFSEGLYLVKKDYKYGFMNEKGDIVIPFDYDYANDFQSGVALVETENGRQYINKYNKIITANHTFVNYYGLENGYIRVEDNYIDSTGRILSKKEAFYAKYPSGVRTHYQDGYFDFYDYEGELVAEVEGQYINPFIKDKALMRKMGSSYIVNSKGEILFVNTSSYHVTLLNNGLVLVNNNNEYTLLDEELNKLKTFKNVDRFEADYTEGLLGFYDLNNNLGYIDETGEVVVIAHKDNELIREYEWIEPYRHSNMGIINQKGDWVIEPSFYMLGKFSNGLIPASKDGAYGYINIKGEWVIPQIYSHATDFYNGLALVSKGEYRDKCYLIDTQGRFVKYLTSGTPRLTNGKFFVDASRKNTAYDSKGEEIIEDEFEPYSKNENGIYIEKDNKRISDYYEHIYENNDGYIAYKNETTYVLDSSCNVLCSKEGFYYFYYNSKYGKKYITDHNGEKYLVDLNLERVDDINYDELTFIDNDYISYRKGLEVGYLDGNLKKTIIRNAKSIINTSNYSEIIETIKVNKDSDLSSDSEFRSEDSIYYSPTGHAFINNYDKLSKLKEGRIKVTNRHTGFYDKDFNLIIVDKYESAEDFSEGLAAVNPGNLIWYYIDYFGQRVSPMYLKTTSFNNGYAIVKGEHAYGIINKDFEYVSNQLGDTYIKTDEKYCLISHDETIIFDVKTGKISKVDYIVTDVLEENKFIYKKDSLYGLIDINNNVIKKEKYHSYFNEGKFLVFKEETKEDDVLINEVFSVYYDYELVFTYDSIIENKKNLNDIRDILNVNDTSDETYSSFYNHYNFSTHEDMILIGQYLVNGNTKSINRILDKVYRSDSISNGLEAFKNAIEKRIKEYEKENESSNVNSVSLYDEVFGINSSTFAYDYEDMINKYYDIPGYYESIIDMPGYISNFKDGFAINVHKGIVYKVNKSGQRLEELEVINLQSEDIHYLPEEFLDF